MAHANERERESKCGYDPDDLEAIDTRLPIISPHLLEYKINPKAFINAHNFPNLNALVDEVKRIDNDWRAYKAMLDEPLFLDGFNPRAYYKKRLRKFLLHIFKQSPNIAFRRGNGQFIELYTNYLKDMRKLSIS